MRPRSQNGGERPHQQPSDRGGRAAAVRSDCDAIAALRRSCPAAPTLSSSHGSKPVALVVQSGACAPRNAPRNRRARSMSPFTPFELASEAAIGPGPAQTGASAPSAAGPAPPPAAGGGGAGPAAARKPCGPAIRTSPPASPSPLSPLSPAARARTPAAASRPPPQSSPTPSCSSHRAGGATTKPVAPLHLQPCAADRRRLEIYAMNAILAAHEEAQARAALAKHAWLPAGADTGGDDCSGCSSPTTAATAGAAGPARLHRV
jgi:hypothetical protein